MIKTSRRTPLHASVKKVLGYSPDARDSTILADWRQRVRRVCKPCWELKYCPYGPLVEEFPLPPLVRSHSDDHHEYLRACLKSGRLADGSRLDPQRRRMFEEDLKWSAKQDRPDTLPSVLIDVSCRVFGHVCPVFFVAEPLTETADRRRSGRSIPRDVMLKVVRRDGQICQQCHEPVRDDEVEFDHVIPFARGGTSTADNLRLVHRDCNRQKSDSLNEILAPEPLVHFFELQRKNWRRRAAKKR